MSLKKKRRVIQIQIQFRVPIFIVLTESLPGEENERGFGFLKNKNKK